MTFPLYIFLFLYFAFLTLWLIFSLIAVYHILKFGFKNFITFFTTFIYISVSVIMLFGSYYYISQIDWNMNITILRGLFNINFQL